MRYEHRVLTRGAGLQAPRLSVGLTGKKNVGQFRYAADGPEFQGWRLDGPGR